MIEKTPTIFNEDIQHNIEDVCFGIVMNRASVVLKFATDQRKTFEHDQFILLVTVFMEVISARGCSKLLE